MPRLTTKDREESKDPKGESNKSKGSREVGDRVGRKPLTLLDAHKERWKDGCGAEICSRSRRVFSRGKIPCHVLLIGEAPGESENVLGVPFIGPAGKLLDRIVKEAIKDRTLCPKCISKGVYSLLYYDCLTDDRDFGEEKKLTCEPGHEVRISEGIEIRVAFTNMVCCLPRNDDGGKATKPDDDDVESCGDRLAEFVKIADPKLIVCVGEVARDWLDPQWKKSVKLHRPIPRISIIHPAAILRMNVSMQGLSYQRAVVTLSNGLEDMG
jgi:uracil-DNA glycosylase